MALTDTANIKPEAGENYAIYDVAASVEIFAGAALGWSGAAVRPHVDGDQFAGFALQSRDNSGGAAGDLTVKVLVAGRAELAVSGATTDANIADVVYVKGDNGFSTTDSGSDTPMGMVKKVVSSGVAVVAFDAIGLPGAGTLAGLIAHLTDTANPHETTLAKAAAEGGLTVESKSGAGPHTLNSATDVLFIATGGGNVAVTIPTPVGRAGRPLYLKRTTADGDSVTYTPAAGQIEGAANLAVDDSAKTAVTLISDNSNWWIQHRT